MAYLGTGSAILRVCELRVASLRVASLQVASLRVASLRRSRKVLVAVCTSGLFWALSPSFYFIKIPKEQVRRAG